MPCGQKNKTSEIDPQPDGDSAVGGDGRDHVQVEDSDHEQQNQIGAAEDALEMRLVRIVRGQYLLLGLNFVAPPSRRLS